jgi:hypothetical protein
MLPMRVVLLVLPLAVDCLNDAQHTLCRHLLLLLRGLCAVCFRHPHTLILLTGTQQGAGAQAQHDVSAGKSGKSHA